MDVTPTFDPSQASAFYYVRVLEIPTPRWTTYDAKIFVLGATLGERHPKDGYAGTRLHVADLVQAEMILRALAVLVSVGLAGCSAPRLLSAPASSTAASHGARSHVHLRAAVQPWRTGSRRARCIGACQRTPNLAPRPPIKPAISRDAQRIPPHLRSRSR